METSDDSDIKLKRGFSGILKEDLKGQADLVTKVLPGWSKVDRSKIHIKDISGGGGSKTFMVSCETAEPSKIILHSRNMNTSDTYQENRMIKIQKILGELGLAPARLYYGSDWSIEQFYGSSKGVGLFFYDEKVIK